MLEELRDKALSLLEERVELAINTIQSLQEDKRSLESQISQLQDEIQQKEEWIQDLENRNQELLHVESDLKQLQEERDQERDEIDQEKTEIRERIEGLMTMLNGVDSPPRTNRSRSIDRRGRYARFSRIFRCRHI